MFVAQVVADVREPGMIGLEFFDERERLLDIRVHGMGHEAKCVEDEMVEPVQERLRRFWNGTEVSKISSVSKAKTENLAGPMLRGNRNDPQAEELERALDRVKGYAGQGTIRRFVVEDVSERPLQDVQSSLRAIHGNRGSLFQIVRPDIIEAEDVVRVRMGIENRVEPIDSRSHSLSAEVRGRVDHHVMAAVGEQNGWAGTLVMRIVRFANRAMAAERRNAHRGTGTENGQFE